MKSISFHYTQVLVNKMFLIFIVLFCGLYEFRNVFKQNVLGFCFTIRGSDD